MPKTGTAIAEASMLAVKTHVYRSRPWRSEAISGSTVVTEVGLIAATSMPTSTPTRIRTRWRCVIESWTGALT